MPLSGDFQIDDPAVLDLLTRLPMPLAAVDATEDAAKLGRQLLAFSRSAPPDLKPCALGSVVQESVALLKPSLPPGVTIEITTDGNAPDVLILELNAIAAMRDRRDHIRFRLADAVLAGDKIIRHRRLAPARYACVTIQDEGCGMDEHTLARAFAPFFTTKSIGQGMGQGMGLGLAVGDGIMDTHSAAITAQSEPGVGCTFAGEDESR